jgi:hypothetical protein
MVPNMFPYYLRDQKNLYQFSEARLANVTRHGAGSAFDVVDGARSRHRCAIG